MPGVRVKEGEPIESAIRRFKKQCEKAGILSELRKREHYEKPSVRRKKKALAARKRAVRRTVRKRDEAAHGVLVSLVKGLTHGTVESKLKKIFKTESLIRTYEKAYKSRTSHTHEQRIPRTPRCNHGAPWASASSKYFVLEPSVSKAPRKGEATRIGRGLTTFIA